MDEFLGDGMWEHYQEHAGGLAAGFKKWSEKLLARWIWEEDKGKEGDIEVKFWKDWVEPDPHILGSPVDIKNPSKQKIKL